MEDGSPSRMQGPRCWNSRCEYAVEVRTLDERSLGSLIGILPWRLADRRCAVRARG